MKSKVLLLFTFALLVALSFVASVRADVVEVTGVTFPQNVSRSAGSFTVGFNVAYTGANNSTTITFTPTISTGNANIASIPSIVLQNNNVTTHVETIVSFSSNAAGSTISGTITVDPSAAGNSQVVPFTTGLVIDPNTILVINSADPTIAFNKNATFTLTNNGLATLTNIQLTTTGAFTGGFSPSNQLASLGASTTSSTFTLYPISTSNLRFGNNVGTVVATSGNVQATKEFTFQKTFCSQGRAGTNLTIDSINYNNKGDGDDDRWLPLDDVKISVDVHNNAERSVSGVHVKIGLFNDDGSNDIGQLDFTSADEEDVDLGSVGSGDTDTADFEFKVPADFDDGHYRLAVKVYKSGDENRECDDSSSDLNQNIYQDIEVEKQGDDDKQIIVDNFEFPTETGCAVPMSGSVEVFNVGTDDQDQVRVTVFNSELRLNKEYELRENLDQGDSQLIPIDFDIPAGIRDGKYLLQFKTEYDYRNGEYRQESKDTFTTSIKVIGCGVGSGSGSTNSGVRVDASLQSEATPGQALKVRGVITNTANERKIITVDATGYSSWATLTSISKRTVSLEAGQSTTVDFAFDVDQDASGSQSFTIETTSNGMLDTQDVEVNFATDSSPGFSFGGSSSLIWIIAAVNLVLIILIILVAVRLSHR